MTFQQPCTIIHALFFLFYARLLPNDVASADIYSRWLLYGQSKFHFCRSGGKNESQQQVATGQLARTSLHAQFLLNSILECSIDARLTLPRGSLGAGCWRESAGSSAARACLWISFQERQREVLLMLPDFPTIGNFEWTVTLIAFTSFGSVILAKMCKIRLSTSNGTVYFMTIKWWAEILVGSFTACSAITWFVSLLSKWQSAPHINFPNRL